MRLFYSVRSFGLDRLEDQLGQVDGRFGQEFVRLDQVFVPDLQRHPQLVFLDVLVDLQVELHAPVE